MAIQDRIKPLAKKFYETTGIDPREVAKLVTPTPFVNGGKITRRKKWPRRKLFNRRELAAVKRLFRREFRVGGAIAYEGREEQAYCRKFVRFMGGGYADAVNSGTAAVYVALRALDLEPFTEVILSPITDPGGYMPVVLANCIPVPADSVPGSYNVGAAQIEARLTDKTSAIVVTHVAGYPVDMDPILELARSRGIPVMEDCAQAHGAKYKGRLVGTLGEIAAFSTMFGKHHATGGQGGVVYTANRDHYCRAKQVADRGKPVGVSGTPSNLVASLNLNQDEIACAIGRVQLDKMPGNIRKRRGFVLALGQACRELVAVEPVLDPPGCEAVYWFMLFKLHADKLKCDKATFVAALKAEGIAAAREHYYYVPCESPWYTDAVVFGASGFPWQCERYGRQRPRQYDLPNVRATDAAHFNLTIHENLGQREISDFVAACKKLERLFVK